MERDGKQCENHDQGDREPAVQRIQGFELLLLFPSEAVCQARVQGGQVSEDRIGQDVVGFVTGNHRRIDVRRDRDDALAVLAPDGRRRHARVQRSHTHDRDLGPARGADVITFDIGNGIPLIGGQAHIDPDLFPAALHPDRLCAEERGTRPARPGRGV